MTDFAKNITDLCTIPKTCRERFLPLTSPGSIGNASPLSQCGINFAGVSELVPGYSISRRKPDFHLIIFGVGGQGIFATPEHEGNVLPGTIWVCPAGTPQVYHVESSWKILFFHLNRDSSLFKSAFSTSILGQARAVSQLENAMIWLINEHQSQSRYSPQLYNHYASIIHLCLERELDGLQSPAATRTSKKLDGLWQEVSECLSMPWSLSELSRRLNLSEAQLRRVVQAQHSCAPMEMVNRLRIQKAQQLLRTTSESLENIAERVGYSSPFSLSRAFKKSTGLSPRAWKNTHTP